MKWSVLFRALCPTTDVFRDSGWPGRAVRGMALLLALTFASDQAALAQQGNSGLFWQCAPPTSTAPQGGYCPVNNSYPVPMTAGVTGGGASIFRSTTLTNSAVAVKASAGTVSFLHVANVSGSAVTCYLHLYNVAAASVTVGTTVPTWSMVLPASTVQTVPFTVPLQFSTAISAAATTTAGGSTACGVLFTLTEIAYK